jgi:oxygen-dependent protoporphyrinogen oxidase
MSALNELHRADSRQVEVAIVGGGISGLVAAWELRDRDVLVLESTDCVGGRIRSETRGPYWLNLGAHIFPGPDTVLDRIVREVGLETRPVLGSTMGVLIRGKLVSPRSVSWYPLRLPMSLSARASLARAGLKIRRGVSEYFELSRQSCGDGPARRKRLLAFGAEQTFSQFLGRLHPDVDALMRAAINRVAADPEQLSAGGGITQFATVFTPQHTSHRNLPGGSTRLPEEIARILGPRVATNASVSEVANGSDGVLITYRDRGNDRQVLAKVAIVTTPAPVARTLLRDAPPALRASLDEIVYGPYVVAGILTGEQMAMPWDRVYAAVVPGMSFNMFFNVASTLRTGTRIPGGSLMVYGGASLGKRLMEQDDETATRTLLSDLKRVFPGMNGLVDEVVIQRWNLGIPYSRPGRASYQEPLEEGFGRILLAGDYIAHRGGMDTAAEVASEKAIRARELLLASSSKSSNTGRPEFRAHDG